MNPMIICACLLLAVAALTTAAPDAQRAAEYAQRSRAAFHQELLDLATKASISSLPEHVPDILSAADWLRDKLSAIGLQDVQILPTEGPHPVVYASHSGAGPSAPTVLVYAHYDVQPVDPLALWDAPPFEPAVRDGMFWGRGVDDDKGGLLSALHAVESYLQGSGGALPVNIKVLLEGQEEIGSPNLAPFLRKHKHGLLSGIDLALSADGGQISETQPCIPTGFRGAVALQVDIRTAGTDLHSGSKGGSVQNAAHAMVQLLASLRDPVTGRVAVEGFFDSVVEPEPEDKADMERYPMDAAEEAASMGVLGFMGEQGRSTLERRWYRPTLEIVGMISGFTGEGIKTIVPATATAKLSARLVPNMTPDDVSAKVKAHLEKFKPPLTNMTVQLMTFRADPWTSPRDTPGNQAAARVLRRIMGAEPLFVREGATVPALAYFQEILGVPTTVFAFSLGDHIHAPNERFKVSMFDKGTLAWIQILDEIGKLPLTAFATSAGGGGHTEL